MIHKTMKIREIAHVIPMISQQEKDNEGHITPIIKSEPGCGKTSILKMLQEEYGDDKYDYIYADCPVLDYSDVMMTIPDKDTKQLQQYIGSMWRMDSPKPKIILLDEFMKSPKMMQLIFNRMLLERSIGDTPLPVGSIVFGTSNNEEEGLGDSMLSHEGNRVCLIQMIKPTADEWLEDWANNNNINPLLKSFVKSHTSTFASYKDEGQKENAYIYHPQKAQMSFASPRSIAKVSRMIDRMDTLYQPTSSKESDDSIKENNRKILLSLMAGTVGASFAGDFVTTLDMAEDIPKWEDVINNPETATVPDNIQVQMIVMYQAVDRLKSHDEVSSFMKYVNRIPHKEIQTMFFTMCFKTKRMAKYAGRNIDIAKWGTENNYIL